MQSVSFRNSLPGICVRIDAARMVFKRPVNDFLRKQWRFGALHGASAEEAFFVIYGRTTTAQNDIGNGPLIWEIAIAPVWPAEFVILRGGKRARDRYWPWWR